MAGIVVGYDGTESSKVALDAGIGLPKDVAQDRDARMIVEGSPGEGPIKGAILGSAAHRLVHTSQTPVLVVRT